MFYRYNSIIYILFFFCFFSNSNLRSMIFEPTYCANDGEPEDNSSIEKYYPCLATDQELKACEEELFRTKLLEIMMDLCGQNVGKKWHFEGAATKVKKKLELHKFVRDTFFEEIKERLDEKDHVRATCILTTEEKKKDLIGLLTKLYLNEEKDEKKE